MKRWNSFCPVCSGSSLSLSLFRIGSDRIGLSLSPDDCVLSAGMPSVEAGFGIFFFSVFLPRSPISPVLKRSVSFSFFVSGLFSFTLSRKEARAQASGDRCLGHPLFLDLLLSLLIPTAQGDGRWEISKKFSISVGSASETEVGSLESFTRTKRLLSFPL